MKTVDEIDADYVRRLAKHFRAQLQSNHSPAADRMRATIASLERKVLSNGLAPHVPYEEATKADLEELALEPLPQSVVRRWVQLHEKAERYWKRRSPSH
jgi:hypothetical protein